MRVMKKKDQPRNVDLRRFHYRDHDASYYRVWMDDWYGDQFEIMSREEFANFEVTFKRFGFRFVYHEED